MWVLLGFAAVIAAAALTMNVWATLRVVRFQFTTGQRVAQIALIWLVPGFCLLSLMVTRPRFDPESFYKDHYAEDLPEAARSLDDHWGNHP